MLLQILCQSISQKHVPLKYLLTYCLKHLFFRHVFWAYTVAHVGSNTFTERKGFFFSKEIIFEHIIWCLLFQTLSPLWHYTFAFERTSSLVASEIFLEKMCLCTYSYSYCVKHTFFLKWLLSRILLLQTTFFSNYCHWTYVSTWIASNNSFLKYLPNDCFCEYFCTRCCKQPFLKPLPLKVCGHLNCFKQLFLEAFAKFRHLFAMYGSTPGFWRRKAKVCHRHVDWHLSVSVCSSQRRPTPWIKRSIFDWSREWQIARAIERHRSASLSWLHEETD